jgi:hypothetical protein
MFNERGIVNKAAVNQASQLRNKLYKEGVKIEIQLLKAQKDFVNDDVTNRYAFAIAIGKAQAYVEIRNNLSPTIALDILSKKLGGRVKMLLKTHF